MVATPRLLPCMRVPLGRPVTVLLACMAGAQTFAERLFARLQRGGGERVETRLAITALVSRVVGVHRLLLLHFYPFLQKYLQPHQRDVTQLLAALVQARHTLIIYRFFSRSLTLGHNRASRSCLWWSLDCWAIIRAAAGE